MEASAKRALVYILARNASPVMVSRGVGERFRAGLIRRFALAFHSAKSLSVYNIGSWSVRTNSRSVLVPTFFIPPCNFE